MGSKSIQISDVPKLAIIAPKDAIISVTYCCICGSDLHMYGGEMEMYMESGDVLSHEAIGSVKLTDRCCAPCWSRIDTLDELINNVMQVAIAIEESTDHRISSGDSQNCDSVPSTPQLPRQHRWSLPIDSETDGE
jgi:D-arabinose 1-dehydrogenase-like Zn-dependent alcohol dehydrogenase